MDNQEPEQDILSPQEEAAIQDAQEHQFDNVDPMIEFERFIGSVDEAKTWLEDATGALIQAEAGSTGWKEFHEGLEALRVALGAAMTAVEAIQPNEYLAEMRKRYLQDQDRAEGAHDALSY